MKNKKRVFIKVAIVLSLFVINGMAATRGSRCTINAKVLGIINATLSGTVNNSNMCIPLGLLPPVLNPLGTGTDCNLTRNYGIIVARTSCPY